jgi:mRNA interferase MazF
MRKGEIWRARLPVAPGHVQAGERPVLIIQNDTFSALPTVLVTPFTGTLAAARFGGTLVVPPDGRNGLTTRSVALVFQARAVDKQDLITRLGILDSATLARILSLLGQLTA